MSPTVYDASLITFRKRAKALNAYYTAIKAANNSGGGCVRREQGNYQTGEVIPTRKQGGCFCAQDAAGQSIQPNAPGPCCGGR